MSILSKTRRTLSEASRERIAAKLTPYWFILPAVLFLVCFIGYPVIYSFWLSFHKYQMNMPSLGKPYVGFKNYIEIPRNAELLNSIRWTLMFTFCAVPIEFILGFLLAILVNSSLLGKIRGTIRGLLLIPMMLTGVVAGFTWRMILNPEYGPMNHILSLVGLPRVTWLADITSARVACVTADVWLTTPFVMLILLAGLQSIPGELYEAARIDGASSLQMFWRVTLPLVRYSIMIVLVIRTMDALRAFDLMYLLTQGGPGLATTSVMYYNYRYAFNYYQMGRASAVSFVILIVIALITAIYINLLRRGETN